jgi:hypothetical protein
VEAVRSRRRKRNLQILPTHLEPFATFSDLRELCVLFEFYRRRIAK